MVSLQALLNKHYPHLSIHFFTFLIYHLILHVPTQLKIAKVVPIFKAGDRACMDNYRPISLLSTFSKILEKIVAIRLLTYLDNNIILSKWQTLI